MGKIMADKTVQHRWLEQKVSQLQLSISSAKERGDSEALKNYNAALTTLQGELFRQNERFERAEALEKQIEERKNW
jgi:hypothetical protein